MTFRYKTAMLAMAFSFFYVHAQGAFNLAGDSDLRVWFRENRLFVDAQFQYLRLPVGGGCTREVSWYINRYLRTGRSETERMLGRAAFFLPLFESELQAQGLPAALKYLPIIESGLYANIESPAGAVGLWQIMPGTARLFRMEINDWVDERRDPYRATQGAVRMLAHLHQKFGDWELALAAYNCGPGRVQQAIARAASRRFQKIRPYLPAETRAYVSKYKAAAYVAVFHELFGLQPKEAPFFKTTLVRVAIDRSVSFGELAGLTQAPVSTLRLLNPGFRRGLIPAGRRPRYILLPKEAAAQWAGTTSGEGTPLSATAAALQAEPIGETPPQEVVDENKPLAADLPPDSGEPVEEAGPVGLLLAWYQRYEYRISGHSGR